jgi:hypothetical protein
MHGPLTSSAKKYATSVFPLCRWKDREQAGGEEFGEPGHASGGRRRLELCGYEHVARVSRRMTTPTRRPCRPRPKPGQGVLPEPGTPMTGAAGIDATGRTSVPTHRETDRGPGLPAGLHQPPGRRAGGCSLVDLLHARGFPSLYPRPIPRYVNPSCRIRPGS